MLRVVGLLLLGGLLGVARVGLSCWGGSRVSSLPWGGLVGHVGHVVLTISIRVVAHGHLVEPGTAAEYRFVLKVTKEAVF